MLNEKQIEALAERVAKKVIQQISAMSDGDETIRGVMDIARFLGVSANTLRRRHLEHIPICGSEQFRHLGKPSLRIICKRSELKAYRDSMPKRKSRLTLPV